MNTLWRAAMVGGIAVVLAAGAGHPLTRAGADQPAPFSDPNAKGFLALCDQHGNSITGGRVDARPFVWKAVSSFAPPSGYLGKGENAALTIYQARQGVDPGNWNGDQLTGASYFTNPKLPAAQATYADLSLSVIVREFPPMWNGLYQLRMVFAKTGYGNYSSTYPTTVIKVSGNSWKVVQGGSLPCGSAKTVSNESFFGIGKKPLPPASAAPAGIGSGTVGAGPNASAAVPAASAQHARYASWSAGWLLALVVGCVAAVAGIWLLLWRRSRRFSLPPTLGAVADDRDAVISGRTTVR